MMRTGRPLRFLALVMGGWIGMRTILLWPPGATLPQALRTAFPLPTAIASSGGIGATGLAVPNVTRKPAAERSMAKATAPGVPPTRIFSSPAAGTTRTVNADRVQLAMLALIGFGTNEPDIAPAPLAGPLPPLPLRPAGPHADLSIWALARPGAASGGPVQLGGGQLGARVRVPVALGGRFALTSRLASPLQGPGRELAIGSEWRPVDAPIAVVVEHRQSLDRSLSGPGIGAVGGIDRALPLDFDLEAYAQSGVVLRRMVEPYADGAMRVIRSVTSVGDVTVRLGGGGWGGAQRGAARLDVGPTAIVSVPVGARALRLAVDWRQRVAGNAAPGSGPAVTLGADF